MQDYTQQPFPQTSISSKLIIIVTNISTNSHDLSLPTCIGQNSQSVSNTQNFHYSRGKTASIKRNLGLNGSKTLRRGTVNRGIARPHRIEPGTLPMNSVWAKMSQTNHCGKQDVKLCLPSLCHMVMESGPPLWICIYPSANHPIQLTHYSNISKVPAPQ